MASQPIVDPATIITENVAVTKDEILELNAQRDEFEQLDRLISIDLEEGLAVGIKTQKPTNSGREAIFPGTRSCRAFS